VRGEVSRSGVRWGFWLVVASQGSPLFARVVGGACHEGAETGQLLEQLRALAGPRRLLLVADSALVTKSNLAAADAAGIRFVSRLPRSFDCESHAVAQPEDSWRTLAYLAERGRRLLPADRPSYRGARLEPLGPTAGHPIEAHGPRSDKFGWYCLGGVDVVEPVYDSDQDDSASLAG